MCEEKPMAEVVGELLKLMEYEPDGRRCENCRFYDPCVGNSQQGNCHLNGAISFRVLGVAHCRHYVKG